MTVSDVPKSHPRYTSLRDREIIVKGVEDGITSLAGLTAHGRGEAFDYLLGEKTSGPARKAVEATCALFLLSDYPVISVNGNTAALVPVELVKLSNVIGAKIEVNLFHASKQREKKIVAHLKKNGAEEVLLPGGAKLPGIKSNRRMISAQGQKSADTIFVPLEDGDRTEALISMGKKVVTVDLNPLSRTAKKATISIVDNIVRVLPLMIELLQKMKKMEKKKLQKILDNFDNGKNLSLSLLVIKKRLKCTI